MLLSSPWCSCGRGIRASVAECRGRAPNQSLSSNYGKYQLQMRSWQGQGLFWTITKFEKVFVAVELKCMHILAMGPTGATGATGAGPNDVCDMICWLHNLIIHRLLHSHHLHTLCLLLPWPGRSLFLGAIFNFSIVLACVCVCVSNVCKAPALAKPFTSSLGHFNFSVIFA